MAYVYYWELQNYMKSYYETTGKMLTFVSTLTFMQEKNLIHYDTPIQLDFSQWDGSDLDSLNHLLSQISIPLDTAIYLEDDSSLPTPLIVFKYPSYSKAGIHTQDGLEVNYIYSGSCTMHFEGSTYTMHENELYIIPPHTQHDVYDIGTSIVFSFIIHQDLFDDTFFQVLKTDSPLSSFYSVCLQQSSKTFLRFQISDSTQFIKTFLNMFTEFNACKPYYNEICANYIRILFSYLLRNPICNYEYSTLDISRSVIENLPIVLHYIKENYQRVSLNFLADFFHYDRSYLGKLIKRYTNLSFTELVSNYRMEHARRLLTNSSASIEEIAETTGFHSADHFSRMFKKRYNLAPSKYRALYKNLLQ